MFRSLVRWFCYFLYNDPCFHFGGQIYFIQSRPIECPRGMESRRPAQQQSDYG